MDEFRKGVELKYKLMPYVYAQAKDSAERGLPMVRALFVEYPDDPGSWLVDDEYLFGSDILVAPLFEARIHRARSSICRRGSGSTTRPARPTPAAGTDRGGRHPGGDARAGRRRPAAHQARAVHQGHGLVEPGPGGVRRRPRSRPTGLVCLPSDNVLHRVTLPRGAGGYRLAANPLAGRSALTVRMFTSEGLQR